MAEQMRITIVPGLAVRRYVGPATDALRARGHDVDLRPAPGLSGGSPDLRRYGEGLAAVLRERPTDVLIGLSMGAVAAAVATVQAPGRVGCLVLVSPTQADTGVSETVRLVGRWAMAGQRESPALLLNQWPEWMRTGPVALGRGLLSASQVGLYDTLTQVDAPLVLVRGDRDEVCRHVDAARLAADHGGRLVIVPGAVHSWPFRDAERFADVIDDVGASVTQRGTHR